MKIVTLTLNPALDKSTGTERLIPEQKLRCSNLQIDPGGGGINVSRGIGKLGGRSTAVFPAGGNNGLLLEQLLRAREIDVSVHPIASETRENISVTEQSTNLQYRFTLSGQDLAESDADACLERIRALMPDILVASGSLAPGLPTDYYHKVAVFARQIGAKLVLDTSGIPLKEAAQAGLFLLKPNLGELSALVGVETLEINQVDDAALELIGKGICEVVVVSLGPQGALLATREGFEHIPAPMVKKKTTVGAGDSMVAGMMYALSQGKSHREMTQMGVACGSAATLNLGTQLFQTADAHRLFQWIQTYGDRYKITDFD
ncbi:MAG: 1-phosphofructokinase family hexose kinase [Bacteroidetes bacterium]|nr:1-phosphofructokinase family hexose kinase [Bacteroidota bacterium]